MDLKWCTKLDVVSIEEMSCCVSRSSITFQGHTGWKFDDLNPIWVRLLLPNPSDLPCYSRKCIWRCQEIVGHLVSASMYYLRAPLVCGVRSTSSWWFQVSWCHRSTRPSATTMRARLWWVYHTSYYVTQVSRLKPLNVGNSVALRPCSHSYDTLCVPGNSRHAFNAIISYIAGQKW